MGEVSGEPPAYIPDCGGAGSIQFPLLPGLPCTGGAALRNRISERWAETALAGASALALAGALLRLAAPASPPDWTALWNAITALPWGGPLWLLLRAALTLAGMMF